MVKRIAIVPARGGSKRIPKKNVLPFMGKPMLAWTVDAALESGCFDKVLVSTDSEEIAETARAAGAEVPFLRDGSADDIAPVSEAVLTALRQAQAHWGIAFDTVAQLMANCPLRTAEDIRNAIATFDEGARRFQISVFKFGWMNPWWAMKVDGEGVPEPLIEGANKMRSQDLEALYCPTGAVWLARCADLMHAGSFYGPDYRVCELPWISAVDIDDYEDLTMARAAYMVRAEDG